MFVNRRVLISIRIKNIFAIIDSIQYTNTDNEIQSKWDAANVIKSLVLTKQSQNFHYVKLLFLQG